MIIKSRLKMSDDYGSNTIHLLRARKLKNEGGKTCYVLLDIRDVENTTVETTKVVAVCSTRENAEKILDRCGHRYHLVEFVMDPPLIETKFKYHDGKPDLFPKIDVMPTSSDFMAGWKESRFTDEQAENYIEREEGYFRREQERDYLYVTERRVIPS